MSPEELISKYNIPVPRYTSYPPANYFSGQVGNSQYEEAIRISNTDMPRHLSFYIHIPFCRHLCHYCGCNSIAMMKPDVVDKYIETLHMEMDKVISCLDKERRIAQIHYGGGSPTTLPVEILQGLNQHLLSSFDLIEEPEIAIECHPGYLDKSYWQGLIQAGFNRISIGVQDFNPAVLKAVNRRPSLLPIEEIFELLRASSVRINLDLLYGLPLQTVESFSRTVEQAAALSPDRLVTFSYGHIPWVNPAQRILEKTGFPPEEEKKQMYEHAKNILTGYGYKTIGLDHFVKAEDELHLSLQNNILNRNFQGYCSKRTTGQVYAFGATGISQLNTGYMQNCKDVREYMERIQSGTFAVDKGYVLNKKEQITGTVIQNLMCNYYLDIQTVADQYKVSVEEIKRSVNWNPESLDIFARDGIIEYNETTIRVMPEGALFVRNVAASLDPLMLKSTKNYSKPI